MNQQSQTEIDAWLQAGGRVVAASDRAARALTVQFHQLRRAEGRQAWAAPAIDNWNSFVRNDWERLSAADRLVLNPAQEEALWADLVGASRLPATLLEGPRQRLAALAAQAHGLLCAHAPRFLESARRTSWTTEAGYFSQWLGEFDRVCHEQKLLSAARLPLELIGLLQTHNETRQPLLLVGFDRILPTQREVLEAWGEWRLAAPGEPAPSIAFYVATDPQSEIEACALSCQAKLAADPQARLLVVAQNANLRRGEMERAFGRLTVAEGRPIFEFSLGVPLRQTALARSAFLLLKWLAAPLSEPELDWLLSTGSCAASPQEALALQEHMRRLRRRGLGRTAWPMESWIEARANSLPAAWIERMTQAQTQLASFAERTQSPLDWAALTPRLLEAARWPGPQALSSAEYQALERWRKTLETAGSLGFDGRRLRWQDFLKLVERQLESTLFAPESEDAPIQIVGPAESAGLTADALWFVGADEDSWPQSGSTHPLLPLAVQRESGMPFADPMLDGELAQNTLRRIAASAAEIRFSYACRNENSEARPSKAVLELAGEPQPLPAEWHAPQPSNSATVPVAESAPVPLPPTAVAGGSSVLTTQSQCPFRAFARTRLDAQGWEPAQPCLTAAQRGQLLHEALHSIWSGPPRGLRTHAELLAVANLPDFVRPHVHRAMEQVPAGVRSSSPRRYLELEEERLCRLLAEWLAYESARQPFIVEATEVAKPVTLAGLTLNLRLDRLDRLNDQTLLVVDYKSGNAGPASWDLPRPEDVQLPLYAGFGIDPDEVLGGLVLAKVRAGNHAFAGRVADAQATLNESLTGQSALVKQPLTVELLLDWRDCVQQLAEDFLEGKAHAEPRQPAKTCQHCDLGALCRIREKAGEWTEEEESEEEDDA